MDKDRLQELFCEKISMELSGYHRKMLKKEPEYIFQKAYIIDSIINIYELLLKMSQKSGEDVLQSIPYLLVFFYRRWLKQEDSFTEKLKGSLEEGIGGLQEAYKNTAGKEAGTA